MIGEKLSIRVQILVLLLASGILSFLALGGVLLGSMYGMKESAIVSGREMEESAGNFIEEFVRNQVYRELTLVAREKALQVENKMSLVAADTEYIARAMNKILAHPESCKPWKLPTPAEKRLRGGEAYLLFSEKASGGAIAPALRREIDIAANIADDLEVITKLYLGYDANCYIGSKHGYCIATEGKLSDENYHQVFDAADFAAYDPRERIWYRAAKEAQKAVFTDVYRGRDDSMEITCAAPYYDADGFAGAAGIDLRLDALYRLIADKSFWHSYTYFAINADGDILFSSETEGEISVSAENRNLKTSAEPDFAAAIARMAQGETGAEPVTVGGEKHYLTYAPIPRLGWSFGALTKSDIAAHPVENAGRAVAGISADFAAAVADIFDGRLKEAAVLLLLILAAIVYLSRRTADWFVRPLLGLTDGVRAIAKGDLDRKLYIKTGDEIETLSDSVNTMTEELKAYMENLAAATAEKERVSTELRLAAAIQSGMLPAVSPEFSGRDEYELHAFMDAARKVGGDFYDFYALDEDTLALTIADVSGKGIPASLFMVVAKTVLKNVALSGGWGADFGKVMERANAELCQNNEEMMFVTIFFGALHLRTGEFRYVNAGHNPPLIGRAKDGALEWAYLRDEKKGPMAGVLENATYEEKRLVLSPGDLLFLYTDGVTEAMDDEGRLYTEERLQRTLARAGTPRASVAEILAAVRKDIDEHAQGAEPSDDITMLGLRFRR